MTGAALVRNGLNTWSVWSAFEKKINGKDETDMLQVILT